MTPEDERRRHLRSISEDYPGPPPQEDPGDDLAESTAWAHHSAATSSQDEQGDYPEADPTLEQAVLCALVSSTPAEHDYVEEILGALTPADFTDLRHITIYQAVTEVYARGAGVDPLATYHHLRNAKTLAAAGGESYLHDVISRGTTAAMGATHALTLVRVSERRAVATTARNLTLAARIVPDEDLSERVATELRHGTERLTPRGPTTSTWAPVDLAGILTGEITTVTPSVLARADGEHLLYPGKVHSISGEPGSGKSWLAILGVAQALLEGQAALYCDFEDRPETLIERLRSLGVPDEATASLLRYVRPEQALDPAGELALLRAAQDCPLAIVDGVTEAMGLHGLEMNDNTDVARFLGMLPRRIADVGPAVLQVDHVVKNAEARGRYAIGGQHKLAGIDGVAYKAMVAKPMARGIRGSTRIVIDKDRGGHVGPTGMTAAELILDARGAAEGGTTYLWCENPAPQVASDGGFRPTGLMEKISRYVELNRNCTSSSMEKVIGGKAVYLRQAIAVLVNEGYLSTTSGPRNATLYVSVTEYREDQDR